MEIKINDIDFTLEVDKDEWRIIKIGSSMIDISEILMPGITEQIRQEAEEEQRIIEERRERNSCRAYYEK